MALDADYKIRPTSRELGEQIAAYWGGGGGKVEVNLNASTVGWWVGGRTGAGFQYLKVKRSHLHDAQLLLERMEREQSMGFGNSPADVNALHEMLDHAP